MQMRGLVGIGSALALGAGLGATAPPAVASTGSAATSARPLAAPGPAPVVTGLPAGGASRHLARLSCTSPQGECTVTQVQRGHHITWRAVSRGADGSSSTATGGYRVKHGLAAWLGARSVHGRHRSVQAGRPFRVIAITRGKRPSIGVLVPAGVTTVTTRKTSKPGRTRWAAEVRTGQPGSYIVGARVGTVTKILRVSVR